MANTIDTTFFFGNVLIPQNSDVAVAGSLQLFIDNKEPELLTMLLGYELYKAYAAGIVAGSPLQKWLDLRDGKEYTNRQGYLTKWRGLKFTDTASKKSLIANYVYCAWMENEISITTGTGEKVAANQNAVNVSSVQKVVRAWNEMVKWNWELIEFLLSNESDYTEYTNYYGRTPLNIVTPINTLGI